MRRACLVGLGVVVVAAIGCNGDVCEEFFNGTCPPYAVVGGGGGAGGSSTTATTTSATSSTGGGGEGGTIDPGCIPSMLPSGTSVPAACGIFVEAGAMGTGTPTDPTGNLAQALQDVPATQAVYICGADTFTGTFSLSGGRSVFGGLDCSGWTYNATLRPMLLGNADVPALVVAGAGATKLEDFDVESPNASGPGASSIALVVDTTTADLSRMAIVAGAGATGAAGADQSQTNGATGASGNNGADACDSTIQNNGAMQVVNDCGGGLISIGGGGGNGLVPNGTNGNDGQTGSFGAGGLGQPNMGGGWSCAVGVGGGGDNGSPGSPGSPGSAMGTLASTGFVGATGGAGGIGMPGQGGGGGGGAKGQAGCAGASGGSGGAGGCGGAGAAGGGGGGASFALVVLGADVSIGNSTLRSAAGGQGGAGGLGQPGASGGSGGSGGTEPGPLQPACDGGNGGEGGNGGGGGGGRGGHSTPIVFVGGSAPMRDASTTLMKGGGGMGGTGMGNGIDSGNDGLPGTACSIMDFSGAAEICTVP